MIKLPASDAAFLADRKFISALYPDPAGGAYLVIKDFDVSQGGFAPSVTDLMIRIPAQYPMAPLDMWYCSPPVRIAASGQFATCTEVMETHLQRTWQRFSRHLANWKPGIDGIRSFFTFIQRELQGQGKH
jgi:Prokaryotic E2 family E